MSSTKKRQAEMTKQKILDTGVELIERQGYDDTTIEDITSACDVSVGTFYHYFDSKDAFYYSYINSTFLQVDNTLKEHMDLPLFYNLSHYIVAWYKEIRNSSPDYLAHWLGHSADKEYHTRVNQVQDVSKIHIEAIRNCLRDYCDKGELGPDAPIDDVAEMMVTMLYGIDVRYCMTNGTLDLDDWTSKLMRYVKAELEPFIAVF